MEKYWDGVLQIFGRWKKIVMVWCLGTRRLLEDQTLSSPEGMILLYRSLVWICMRFPRWSWFKDTISSAFDPLSKRVLWIFFFLAFFLAPPAVVSDDCFGGMVLYIPRRLRRPWRLICLLCISLPLRDTETTTTTTTTMACYDNYNDDGLLLDALLVV